MTPHALAPNHATLNFRGWPPLSLTADNSTVISALSMNDVIPAIEAIEAALKKGYHAVGFIAYEAAQAFDACLKTQPHDTRIPLLWFALSKKPSPYTPSKSPQAPQTFFKHPWHAQISDHAYKNIFNTIQQRIHDGDCYQVNYTFPLHSTVQGDIDSLFSAVNRHAPNSYSAWLHAPGWNIVSGSPELFFEKRNTTIITRPMKGTRPRGKNKEHDKRLKEELYHSEKERAENVMIVDLLRNDLGRIATPGTVAVNSLFTIEHYPSVHQMTSEVHAEIPKNLPVVDLFRALFPCGSVTGAPKVKTMEIIAELETSPRGAYCGAIGHFHPNGDSVFNVAIRTLSIFNHDQTYFPVGSGIVADSIAEAEYNECLLKSHIMDLLNQ